MAAVNPLAGARRMDEQKEMQELIKAHEKERLEKLNNANQRTGLDRRAGKDRRKKEAPYDGPDRRKSGRRGKFDRRTEGPNFGYKDEDENEKE